MKWFEVFKKKSTPLERDAHQSQDESPEAPQSKSHKPSDDEAFERLTLLTPRERDLFFLLIKGYTLKESAKHMSVKYSTANTHMTGVYKKLNVNSRAELIIRYQEAVKNNK